KDSLNKSNNSLFKESLVQLLLIILKLLTLLINNSFIFNLLYCSFILFTFDNLTIDKEDFNTFNNLLFLFFNFKEIASVNISLFKYKVFKLIILNSISLLYSLYIFGFKFIINLFFLSINKLPSSKVICSKI